MKLSYRLFNIKNKEDKISIRFHNEKEYNNARMVLESMGYVWASGHLPTELGDDYYRPSMHIGINITEKYIDVGQYNGIKTYSYKSLVSKKIKTIY